MNELLSPDMISGLAETGTAIISSQPVQSLVTAFITTLFLRRDTGTKAIEEAKSKTFNEIADKLLKSGKMTYLEFYKCHNFLKVAKLADEVFASGHPAEAGAETEKTEFDFDWFMRFFDAVGNISNEDLQALWGRVMASELAHSKSCSLRTLDMIRNMSPKEAKTFDTLCKYVLRSGDVYYIDSAGFQDAHCGYVECNKYIERLGLNYSDDIRPLIEAGALSSDQDIAIYLGKETQPLTFGNDRILCIVQGKDEPPILFQQDAYILTASGRELFQIIHATAEYEADKEYAMLCVRELQADNPDLIISAFERAGGDNMRPISLSEEGHQSQNS